MIDGTLSINIVQATNQSDMLLSIALLEKSDAINDVYGVQYVDFLSETEYQTITRAIKSEVLHRVMVCPKEKWEEQRKSRSAEEIIQQLIQHLFKLFFQSFDTTQWRIAFGWIHTDLASNVEQALIQTHYINPMTKQSVPLKQLTDKFVLPPVSTIANILIDTHEGR